MDAETAEAYTKWAAGRSEFNKELKITGSAAQEQKWQKDYFTGSFRKKLRASRFKMCRTLS
jgi:hypothetical protein